MFSGTPHINYYLKSLLFLILICLTIYQSYIRSLNFLVNQLTQVLSLRFLTTLVAAFHIHRILVAADLACHILEVVALAYRKVVADQQQHLDLGPNHMVMAFRNPEVAGLACHKLMAANLACRMAVVVLAFHSLVVADLGRLLVAFHSPCAASAVVVTLQHLVGLQLQSRSC